MVVTWWIVVLLYSVTVCVRAKPCRKIKVVISNHQTACFGVLYGWSANNGKRSMSFMTLNAFTVK